MGSRWRHGVRRVGLLLGLCAIIFQLALLFGHHHFDPSGEHRGSVPVASVLSETGQATTTPDNSGQDPVPAHGPCSLCLAIHAATDPGARAPLLVLPVAYGHRPVPVPVAAPLVPLRRIAAFDSRGPPRA